MVEVRILKDGYGARVQRASKMHAPLIAGYKQITIRNHGGKILGEGSKTLAIPDSRHR